MIVVIRQHCHPKGTPHPMPTKQTGFGKSSSGGESCTMSRQFPRGTGDTFSVKSTHGSETWEQQGIRKIWDKVRDKFHGKDGEKND